MKGIAVTKKLFLLLIFLSTSLFGAVKSTSGSLKFDHDANGTAEATLDQVGLALGKASATANLDVSGNAIITNSISIGTSSLNTNSNLQISGTVGMSLSTFSSNATLQSNCSSIILMDTNAAGGNLLLSLPDATALGGRKYQIKCTSRNHDLHVESVESDSTIDGKQSLKLTANSTIAPFLSLIAASGNWYILNSSSYISSGCVLATYLDDGFDDGDSTDGTDTLDTAWSVVGGSVSTSSVVTDTSMDPYGPGNRVFKVDSTHNDVYIYTPSAMMGNITLSDGEGLRLSFRSKAAQAFKATFQRAGFGISRTSGIYVSQGNADDYHMLTVYGASGSSGRFGRANNTQAVNYGGATTTVTDSLPTYNMGLTPFTVIFEVIRVSSTVAKLRAKIGSNPWMETLDNGSSPAGAVNFNFNGRVIIRADIANPGGATESFYYDDIRLERFSDSLR